jgi:hypothetical protein
VGRADVLLLGVEGLSRLSTITIPFMRIELDEAADTVTFRFSEERQSYEAGGTYLVLADEDGSRPDPIEVQIGFEAEERLLWMSVHPASRALPAELLGSAQRVEVSRSRRLPR